MVVVLEGDRSLLTAVGGESGWRTTLGRDDVNIQAAFSVGSEGNLLAVRAPDRLRVISCVGCQLACLATIGWNAIEIALVIRLKGSAYLDVYVICWAWDARDAVKRAALRISFFIIIKFLFDLCCKVTVFMRNYQT